MALDLVTGYQGKNHVTAEQWADFNRGVYGDAAILPIGNRMQVEIQTANQITVKDGTGVFDGRQVYIGYGESENIAIESGTQEMLRNDIVVIEYTKDESTGVESAAFKVIAGTPAASDPADPSYQDMDIRTGVFVSQKPFCRVRLNGVAIEGVDMLVEVKEFAAHAFQPPAANLTTAEPGQALDATMGKELKEGFDQLTSRNGYNIKILSEKVAFSSGLGTVDCNLGDYTEAHLFVEKSEYSPTTFIPCAFIESGIARIYCSKYDGTLIDGLSFQINGLVFFK